MSALSQTNLRTGPSKKNTVATDTFHAVIYYVASIHFAPCTIQVRCILMLIVWFGAQEPTVAPIRTWAGYTRKRSNKGVVMKQNVANGLGLGRLRKLRCGLCKYMLCTGFAGILRVPRWVYVSIAYVIISKSEASSPKSPV